MKEKVKFPIDFVITWVDENDPVWREKHTKYVKSSRKEDYIRYRDYGTLKYLFRSIDAYAKWVNHVYLVTDNQVPNWIKSNSKLTVVDHKDIIPSKYLPTFNSNVIDFHLVNIPNLSEHFVYFNDDMFLNKKVRPEDFFAPNGTIRDNLALNAIMPSPVINSEFDHIFVNNFQIINSYFNKKESLKANFSKLVTPYNGLWSLISLLLLPFPRISRLVDPHTPISYRRSTITKVLNDFPMIKKMFVNRNRKNNDYSLWLVRYFELLNGNFTPRKISFGEKYSLENIEAVITDIKASKHCMININDASIDNTEFEKNIKLLNDVFSSKFKEKSSFEK